MIEGLIERAGLEIERADSCDPTYSDYLCRKPG
jgi:hypothetical protein